jgi:hypothetical protein
VGSHKLDGTLNLFSRIPFHAVTAFLILPSLADINCYCLTAGRIRLSKSGSMRHEMVNY